MATLRPTINTNTYGFDYYEVAYTCLATQYPVFCGINFPALTFASDQAYRDTLPILLPPCTETTNANTLQFDIIIMDDSRAYDIITNNIGIEFYTKSWDDVRTLYTDLNIAHTYGVGVGGNYTNNIQDQQARSASWEAWWKLVMLNDVPIDEFNLMGVSYEISPVIINGKCDAVVGILYDSPFVNCAYSEPGPRLDSIKIDGRLIVPDSVDIMRNGSITVKGSDIFTMWKNGSMNITVNYSPFSEYFSYLATSIGISGNIDYSSCCIPINDINSDNNNWNMTATLNDSYRMEVIPIEVNTDNATVLLNVTQEFLDAMRANPELLNVSYILNYNIILTIDSNCLMDQVITAYKDSFVPCTPPLTYIKGYGIEFTNAQGFSNGSAFNALDTLNEIKKLIRQIYKSNYNCYARSLSINEVYGDVLLLTGKIFPTHGSECWILLKQVLRPLIVLNNVVTEENLKGFDMPITTTPISPIVELNEIIPTQTNAPQSSLSKMFTKSGNKLCVKLPSPLTYK